MYRWHKVWFAALMLALLSGACNVTRAQTVFRNLELTESPTQQKAVIGLLGEFNQCAAYEVNSSELNMNAVISRAGGMTPQASGLIRIVRGGRISQEIFFSPEMDLTLMHGDVLVAVKSSANLIEDNRVSGTSQSSASRGLVQIAILNLRDYPVVFGVPAEIADLASILRCLRQPVEQYAAMSESIKIIPPERRRSQAQFKTRKLTTRFESGTVLVLGAPQAMNLSLVPHSVPTPRPLHNSAAAGARLHRQTSAPSSISANDSRFRNATPLDQEASITPRQVTHPEEETPAQEQQTEEPEQKSLQLNGPLLQQTSATLAAIPNPLGAASEKEESHSEHRHADEDEQKSSGSSVPDLDLGRAPEAPKDDVQSLLDDERPKSEIEYDEDEAGFWPPGTGFLLLAGVAFALWKYLKKKPVFPQEQAEEPEHELAVTDVDQVTEKQEVSEQTSSEPAAIITSWEELPPLPEKSLLEQILEKQIPVIDETPQIPTQTFIYGRHQSKKARVDQAENLKGPHFLKKKSPDTKVAAGHESSPLPVPDPVREPDEKKLKAPTFRFDRSHPGNTKEHEVPAAPPRPHTGAPGKTPAGSEKKSEQSSILDRVLQAVQGVMPK